MIRFTTVTKDFGTGAPALKELTLNVNPGEFVFLTGPSGSGKTTLLKLITKEYTPTSGEIEFDGESLNDLRGSKIHHHRRRIGVVFQDYRLLSDLNVWENIALALQIIGKSQAEIEERVTDLLELIQLTDKAYHFPAQLSGGESQRVSIARALATAPHVLLADEPTGNLDAQNSAMIAKLFHKIHSLGTTVLFATHDNSILSQLNHRRIYLEKGQLISDTPCPDDTRKNPEAKKADQKTAAKPAAAPTPAAEKSTPPSAEPEPAKTQPSAPAPVATAPAATVKKTRFQRFLANLTNPLHRQTQPATAPTKTPTLATPPVELDLEIPPIASTIEANPQPATPPASSAPTSASSEATTDTPPTPKVSLETIESEIQKEPSAQPAAQPEPADQEEPKPNKKKTKVRELKL